MKFAIPAALAASLVTVAAHAEPVRYDIDPSHSEILFSWTHGGFSTTRGIFFGYDGEFTFDQENPEDSSVSISVPVMSMQTDSDLYNHLMGDDFFGASEGDTITFESTSISVDGDDEGQITGDLTVNGVTQEVTLDVEFNGAGEDAMGNSVVGFSGETTLMRSDFDLGAFAPFVSDEVDVQISLEGSPAAE
ncbi:YceI family protein [Palleronia sp. LCG004]|uniref:YceI family protein n=1 Tax=Palleronia sp. LCG004 TaxID=3079304 RepID=UPI002941F7D2|nr:YceI family protein [Palleronia sp. LCG004]WOI55026.1 YceI family protein [Palleronia sp. LCG004]